MDTDFSCDYLVDITGLVDNGENLYSCCHPSGVMCGKEDCPVVIDFARRCRKDAEANDYDSLARGKLCPLKVAQEPVMLFQNAEPDPDTLTDFKGGVVRVRALDEPPRVEYIGGQCDGPRCAWYDQTAERCAVLSLSRNK